MAAGTAGGGGGADGICSPPLFCQPKIIKCLKNNYIQISV